MKCLHFLIIIMDSFLGQHNPSNYFALTIGILSFPKKLNITLRNLLLTNINIRVVLDYVNENLYLYNMDCIGEYLLIRIHELLSIEVQKENAIKEAIRTAFIKSRENVDEYVNKLEQECNICKCEINYV